MNGTIGPRTTRRSVLKLELLLIDCVESAVACAVVVFGVCSVIGSGTRMDDGGMAVVEVVVGSA